MSDNDQTAGPADETPETWHGIPDDSIILGEIRIVNYLNGDGEPRFGYRVTDPTGGEAMTTVEALGLIEMTKFTLLKLTHGGAA